MFASGIRRKLSVVNSWSGQKGYRPELSQGRRNSLAVPILQVAAYLAGFATQTASRTVLILAITSLAIGFHLDLASRPERCGDDRPIVYPQADVTSILTPKVAGLFREVKFSSLGNQVNPHR
jgi:hypothetical protein